MFAYYLQLGLHSLKRNALLTALMVFGIALGIGTSMTSLTVFYLMGSDPIPWKSDKLHAVQLDNWSAEEPYRAPNEPPDQVTYLDATALMQASKADLQVAMFKVVWPVQPENPEIKPYSAMGRATYTDFFAMFEPPFKYGGPWDRAQDKENARVVVLSRDTNEKLFGGQDSTGKKVRLNEVDYTVVGVLDKWQQRVKYYDLTNGAFNDPEEYYVPFTTAIEFKTRASGNNSCWDSPKAGWEGYLASDCVWIQFWVQLNSPARVAEYKSFLDNYVNEQKKLGRFPRPLNNRLPDVNEWIVAQRVVPSDAKIQVGLSFAFLIVCLVNTVGLLLAKFMRKSGEIGLRRALGATRGQLFMQHLIEAGVIGISGGLIGLVLTWFGLMAVRGLYADLNNVAHLDWFMVLTAIALSVTAAVLAGLFPTWKACQITPATQLKT
ncbi:MAG: ABC transporter substrate-binding protein [Lysobacterales bacterium 69-70]|nr:ABC transporter permease [Xanthomonadaceae bacterium]ODU34358.1 MAG: ABC transporter substrate-binding protein [Xanthomonadaceae bacterium SCN 69-320]ODV22467.1 MAG: ABC transporter substrate-binding protein [Xanthomonadaceae bacterium SCN 69-25]OJY96263.1 MAG: ABC transporter substrate-binding protein [Xanthomonadales bacterium 69-70]